MSLHGSGGGVGSRKRRLLVAALAALLLILPAGAGAAAERYEPGPKVAPGVFLAEAPDGEPSSDREAPRSDDEQKIVGGDTTTIAEWPWQAAVTANPAFFAGNGFQRQFCGGSLVTPTIIVTAAHCTYEIFSSSGFDDVDNFASITGRTTLSTTDGQEIAWSNYFFFVDGSGNPLFTGDVTDGWDVVFAQLASPSPSSNSTPVSIAGADEAASWAPANENAWATGWGTTSSGGSKSDTLREVNIDRIADATCGSATSYGSDFDPETMVCAGEIAGGQDTCQGDSGGPLVTPIGGGTFRLIGDTSWGIGCALPDLPGVYGRVAQHPMCSALQAGIQSVAGANVVGPGGCLGAPGTQISINDVTVSEGNSGQTAANFTVSLNSASSQQVTVQFATSDASATAPGDYAASSGTATFAPGDTSEPVSVQVNGDTVDEPDESFNVDLSSPTNATIADNRGVGTIIDDDFPTDPPENPPAPPIPEIGDTNPPETTIVKGPKAKTKKKKATFEFTSSEPGSSFLCTLDGRQEFKPCTSPLTVKVKKGKHTFQVQAIDQAGNVDPTPTTDTWKRKKKKKQR